MRILFDVIDHPPTEQPDETSRRCSCRSRRVEFANVQFAYRPGREGDQELSFVAEPGKVTALVGPSGGGKSTILNLILRFYEVDGGAIVIDGQNIAAVSRRSLRSQLAYVGQDVFLFRGSVRENIALGRADATEAEIVAAAKAAYAHDFIMAFPARLRYAGGRARHCSSPAASASALRLRGRCSRTRRSSCSTRPPRRSIPNPSGRCSARSSVSAGGARRS